MGVSNQEQRMVTGSVKYFAEQESSCREPFSSRRFSNALAAAVADARPRTRHGEIDGRLKQNASASISRISKWLTGDAVPGERQSYWIGEAFSRLGAPTSGIEALLAMGYTSAVLRLVGTIVGRWDQRIHEIVEGRISTLRAWSHALCDPDWPLDWSLHRFAGALAILAAAAVELELAPETYGAELDELGLKHEIVTGAWLELLGPAEERMELPTEYRLALLAIESGDLEVAQRVLTLNEYNFGVLTCECPDYGGNFDLEAMDRAFPLETAVA